jgi:lysozyme-like protein
MAQTLSFRQLEALYVQAGGSPKLAPVMAAIAKAESGGRTDARHVNRDGSIDQGLWQINSSNSGLYQGKNIYNPQENAQVAVRLAEHSGKRLANWTTYTSGAFRKFLPNVAKAKTAKKPKNFGIYSQGNFAGVDQGVDFRGAGAIPALGTGVVTDVGTSSIIEGGRYPYVIYKLTSGPYKGHYVYVVENFVPKVKKGTKLVAGKVIGIAAGKYPYTETGFNKTAKGWNPSAALSASNPHGSTPAGNTMNSFIHGVAGIHGGGGGILDTVGTVGKDLAIGAVDPFSLVSSGTSAATGAIGNATGIHPEAWVSEAIAKGLDALAIVGGGFIFILGFTLTAADIGLSTRAGRVAAAIPAGRIIAKGARARTAAKTSRRSSSSASAGSRAEERREESHQAKLRETEARTKRHQAAATESRTRQRNRRKTAKEQKKETEKAYYAGARDAASPTMAKIRKNRGSKKST